MLLRYIRYFLAVAEHGNFTRAAESLSISQPTLSQQMKQLEELVGTPLFERTARKIELTDAGALWSAYARRVMQDVDDGMRAIKDVSDLRTGTLRVAFTPIFSSWLVGPIIRAFHTRWPGVTISVNEMRHSTIDRLLETNQLDIGVTFGHHDNPDIEATPLFQEQLDLMVGPSHPWYQRTKPVTPDEVQSLSFILFNEQFATRQHITQWSGQQNIRLNVAIETNSMTSIEAMMTDQNLATILPVQAVERLMKLHRLPLTSAIPPCQVVILERRGGWRSAASQAFRHLLTEFTWETTRS